MTVRRRFMNFANSTGALGIAGRVADRLVPTSATTCTVLTFHRLDTGAPGLYPGLAGLRPEEFREFVHSIAASFVPVGVADLVAAMRGEHRLPARAVLFTFDDAYLDFADVAWPIMRDAGVPVVLFVPTAYVGRPDRSFWWDELYAALDRATPTALGQIGVTGATPLDSFVQLRDTIKTMPNAAAMARVDELIQVLAPGASRPSDFRPARVLEWSALRALAEGGVDLAPHSRTHPMLDRLPQGELDGEIAGSLADMETELGPALVRRVFAYPSGGHDPNVRDAVARAGFDVAFTTERGIVDVGRSDPHRLPRLNIGPSMSPHAVQLERALRSLRSNIRRPGDSG